MILKRFYDDKLAQTSYLVGCAATGEAVVVDPNRDVQQYIDAAKHEGVEITHVTETHIHADFVSGLRELAAATGATMYVSDEGDENWKYAFAGDRNCVLLHDGDQIRVGNIRLDVLHTPGHTPEHITFLVTDGAAADEPIGAITGDFVFVGDVGRPDLLEKAAGVAGTMDAAARALFASLQKFKAQPDWLQIWPGHGAGSACGKGLSSIPHSTVGYERRFNWAFQVESEAQFVHDVLAGQPEPPKYFAQMKRINKTGPQVLGGFRRPARLPAARLAPLLAADAVVVDTRHAGDFAAGHVPGTINIPLNRSFNTWAGWLLSYDAGFYLMVDEDCASCIDEATRDLAMIGLDRIAGYFTSEAVEAWATDGRTLDTIRQISVEETAALAARDAVHILDVRGQAEWEGGHIPGVPNIPLGYLPDRLQDLPRERPLVVHCQTGARSAIATSLLQAQGFTNVNNLAGGFAGWSASGQPVERDAAPSMASHA